MSSAKDHAGAFHTWHSGRTYHPGHSEIDPWMRDVLVALQGTLNELAKQIDENTRRIDHIERFLRTK